MPCKYWPKEKATLEIVHAYVCVCVRVHTQLCPTLSHPKDCSPPGSSVHGILQARILECVAIPSPGDLLDPGTEPGFPALNAGRFFTI